MCSNDNTAKRKFQVGKIEPRKIDPEAYVRVTYEGERHLEVLWMARPIKAAPVKKISADEFIDLRTGEVRKFEKNDKKQRDNLRETFRNLTSLIRTNFDADNNGKQVFITLTYPENMQDHKQLMVDYKLFYKKMAYALRDHKLDYIAVAEPQGRGAWHLHVMLKSDKPLFIPHQDIAKWWGRGPCATSISALRSDDVGRYYVAYFTDLFGEFGPNAKKKGGRLGFYPSGMKFYRCSRGIVKPDKDEIPYVKAIKSWGKPDFVQAFELKDEDEEVVQVVQKEHYKKGVNRS